MATSRHGVALASLLLATSVVHAQPFVLSQTLTAGDSEPGDRFGSAVDFDEGLIAVRSRASFIDDVASQALPNQTHLFGLENGLGWRESSVLSNGFTGFTLGQELAIDGEDLMLGMSSVASTDHVDRKRGGVDFYRIASPSQQATPSGVRRRVEDPTNAEEVSALRADLQRLRDYRLYRDTQGVGRFVDVSGGVAVVGAPATERISSVLGVVGGAVLVYEKQSDGSWAESTPILSPDADARPSQFGTSVAIDGDFAAVSRGWLSDHDNDAEVFLFEREASGAWSEVDRLTFPGTPFANVELNKGMLVARTSAGEAFLYERDTAGDWGLAADLTASPITDGLPADANQIGFGFEVAVEADLVAMTSYGSVVSDVPPLSGFIFTPRPKVNIYRRQADGGWLLAEVLSDPEGPSSGRRFGSSLAIDSGHLLVGAVSDPSFGIDRTAAPFGAAGAAYLFVPVPEPTSLALAGLTLCAAMGQRRVTRSSR